MEPCLRAESLKLKIWLQSPNLQAEAYNSGSACYKHSHQKGLRFQIQKPKHIKTPSIWLASTGNFMSNNSGIYGNPASKGGKETKLTCRKKQKHQKCRVCILKTDVPACSANCPDYQGDFPRRNTDKAKSFPVFAVWFLPSGCNKTLGFNRGSEKWQVGFVTRLINSKISYAASPWRGPLGPGALGTEIT